MGLVFISGYKQITIILVNMPSFYRSLRHLFFFSNVNSGELAYVRLTATTERCNTIATLQSFQCC